MAAASSDESCAICSEFTFFEACAMLHARCSLEAFRERILSCEFNLARIGPRVYRVAASFPELKPIRAWLRSTDFAARVGAIPWELPLGVFFDACKEGDNEYVSRKSQEHPEWLDKGCELDKLPVLHVLCYGGLMQFVPGLVSRVGDVNVQDSIGWTPLYHACWGGQLAVFEYLLSVGADVKAVTRAHETMLHAACWGGNPAIVRALLSMGLDVNARTFMYTTPLLMGCKHGGLDVVSLLVERGADVNAEDKRGETALFLATGRGDVEMVRCLCEHGAVVDPPDTLSPLYEALRNVDMDVAEYLESAGASVERVCEHSAEILNGVAECDSVPAMEWLLKRGIVSVSKKLIDRCLRRGRGDFAVLRYVLLREESAPFVSAVDASWLPAGFLGGYASVSKWREHELRMDLRFDLLSWRRGFVVFRLEG
jgi:ankyrin repeat protein